MHRLFAIVDPDGQAREQLARQLTTLFPGSLIISAPSGEEALAALEAGRAVPSMVFSAFDLPGMSGLELLAAVRQARWLERAPVVVMADRVSDRQVVAVHRLGACALLEKPVRPFELREAVRDFGLPAVKMNATMVVGQAGGVAAVSAA